MTETAKFDFEPAYRVAGHDGIAWRADEFATEVEEFVVGEYPDDYIDYEEVEDRNRVVCHMIGDDRPFTFDVEDLTPLDEEEYCAGCGQIGCGWC